MNDRAWQILVFLIVIVALVWAATKLGFSF